MLVHGEKVVKIEIVRQFDEQGKVCHVTTELIDPAKIERFLKFFHGIGRDRESPLSIGSKPLYLVKLQLEKGSSIPMSVDPAGGYWNKKGTWPLDEGFEDLLRSLQSP